MSENRAVATRSFEIASVDDAMKLGEIICKSGLFPDATTAAKAVVKILAGREMGFGPFASMSDVHIIEGKPSIGAHLKAAAVKMSGKYHYDVLQLDDTACILEFFEGKKSLGKSSFTWQESEEKGLCHSANGKGILRDGKYYKNNWLKSPRNMLFARALSNGYKWYCPDLTGGVLSYDADELEPSGPVEGEIIDAAFEVVEEKKADPEPAKVQEKKADPVKPNGKHPSLAEQQQAHEDGKPITPEQKKELSKLREQLFASMRGTDDVHKAATWKNLLAPFGIDSAEKLTVGHCNKLIADLKSNGKEESAPVAAKGF